MGDCAELSDRNVLIPDLTKYLAVVVPKESLSLKVTSQSLENQAMLKSKLYHCEHKRAGLDQWFQFWHVYSVFSTI